METVEIRCDACNGDLADAGAMPTYRLTLSPERVSNSGSIIYSVAVRPDISRAYHFCGLRCLDHWRARENHRVSLWRDWWDKWKAEHGTKSEDGRVRSYPSPPTEDYDAAGIQFEAAALAAFPMSRPDRG